MSYKEPVYVEAIRDGEIIRVPESVALEEDLFILRKLGGTPQQQKPLSQFMTPVAKKESVVSARGGASLFSEWKLGKFGVKKNNVIQDLVPNFHWQISSNRKQKNLTRHKLAEMIRASENDVKMIELGELPADDFVLISRIEQLFGINLRKHGASIASVSLADLQKRQIERIKQENNKRVMIPSDNENMFGNDIELTDE